MTSYEKILERIEDLGERFNVQENKMIQVETCLKGYNGKGLVKRVELLERKKETNVHLYLTTAAIIVAVFAIIAGIVF